MSLALFFTYGVGLRVWAEVGFLERELNYYRRLSALSGRCIFVTYDRDGELPPFSEEWLSVISNQGNRSNGEYSLQLLREARGLLGGVQAVKTNQLRGWRIAYLCAKKLGIPFIVRCGYLPSLAPWSMRHPFEFAARLLNEAVAFHVADRVMVTTERMRRTIRSRYRVVSAKISVIPNFVDTALFSPRPRSSQSTTIGFVGRLSKEKNLAALIDALAGMRHVRLRVIGRGPEEKELRARCQERQVAAEFLGNVSHHQLPDLLADCDLFVLPSLYEGHPKALLEAMSCGLAVVATPVPGAEEYLNDGETGWVAGGFDAEALRVAIQVALADEGERERRGQAARRFISQRLSVEVVLRREALALESVGVYGPQR